MLAILKYLILVFDVSFLQTSADEIQELSEKLKKKDGEMKEMEEKYKKYLEKAKQVLFVVKLNLPEVIVICLK